MSMATTSAASAAVVSSGVGHLCSNSTERLLAQEGENGIRDTRKTKRIRRAEWAKEYIARHRLRSNTYTRSSAFKDLDRKEQHAVRYQFRKRLLSFLIPGSQTSSSADACEQITQQKQNKKPKLSKKAKPTFWQSLCSLPPVALAEAMIVYLSTQFYVQLDFAQTHALILALCVELFYMQFSTAKTVGGKMMKWALLSYSIFTVAYSTYSRDEGLKKFQQHRQQHIQILESKLAANRIQIKQTQKEFRSLQTSMEIYQKHEKISMGLTRLAKHKADNKTAMKELEQRGQDLTDDLSREKQKLQNESVISAEALRTLEVKSMVIILGFFLIQLSTSLLMENCAFVMKHLTILIN